MGIEIYVHLTQPNLMVMVSFSSAENAFIIIDVQNILLRFLADDVV